MDKAMIKCGLKSTVSVPLGLERLQSSNQDELMSVPLPEKSVIFRPVGGPRDGDVQRSDQAGEAEAYWSMTNGGTIGKGFVTMSPAALESTIETSSPHRYYVTNRSETDDEINVLCEYRPFSSN